MNAPLDLVLGKLPGYKKTGEGQFQARCPAHDDGTASLSVGFPGRDGQVLIHCKANCDWNEVVRAMELAPSDLYPPKVTKPRIVATYDYKDESGALLMQAVRFEPKAFRQCKPDGKGGRDWSTKGVRQVVYRLPEIRAAITSGATIYVVEGEKDADALWAIGCAATCNAAGAGKWRNSHTACLRGAQRVVVIPDRDVPGAKHAAAVAQALAGTLLDVRVLELPGTGKDAHDWLDAGGTRDALEALAAQTPAQTHKDSEAEADDRPAAGSKGYFRTDAGNAERFADRHRDELAWVPNVGWHAWVGARWERIDESSVTVRSTRCALALYDEARDTGPDTQAAATRHALASQSRARIEAAAALAKGYLLVAANKLDRDPMVLNCRNGTVDLRNGTLRPHRREDYITKLAPFAFDPDARCPQWDKFLGRVVPSREVRAFLQRAVGYTLSGDVGAQVLLFLFGQGANGKSVFANVVQAMLGEYASTGAPDLLVERKHEAHPTDLAALWGCRAVICSETEQGRWLAEARVKSLTGGDTIKARFMRQDFFDFEPTHKLWLLGNHQLRVRSTDLAIWRRILQVPFEQTIPENERDPKLTAKLRDEAPGIAAWAVQGCLEWQQNGLAAPREVTEATAAYKNSQDHVGAFLAEACQVADNERCTSAELYAAYSGWCERGGERPWSSTALGTAIRDRKFEKWDTKSGRGWKGISPLKVTGGDGFSGSPREENQYRTNGTTRHYPSPEPYFDAEFEAETDAGNDVQEPR